MRNTDAVLGVVLLVIGLVFLIWIIPAQIEDAETASLPPSFMARFSMGLVVLLAAGLAVKSFIVGRGKPEVVLTMAGLKRFAFALVSLLLSGLAIYYLGFLVGGALCMAGYILYMNERRWRVVLPVAVITAGVCWAVLGYVLKVL